ncbi:hypothetical protein Tco_0227724 [Tanacetum coccineum]
MVEPQRVNYTVVVLIQKCLIQVYAARYEEEGIEERIPYLWSSSIHKYDKDASLDKKYGHGYLKEIVVKRAYQKEYTFMESDFPRLNLNNIEDLYLLKIQDKIHHLDGVDEFDLINSLLIYIKRIVIKKRHCYTTMSEAKGVVYMNKDKQRKLMRFDETHKFSDVILNNVCEKLKVMLTDNVLGFDNANLDRREWTKKDVKRTTTMIKKIEEILCVFNID